MNSVPCSTFRSFTKSFVSWQLRNWIFPLGLNVNQIFELYQPQKNIKVASMSPWGSFLGPNPAWTPWRPSPGVLWAHSFPHCRLSLTPEAHVSLMLWHESISLVLWPFGCLSDFRCLDHFSCQHCYWALSSGSAVPSCVLTAYENPHVFYVSYGALFFKNSFIEICQLYFREVKSLVTGFKWKTI